MPQAPQQAGRPSVQSPARRPEGARPGEHGRPANASGPQGTRRPDEAPRTARQGTDATHGRPVAPTPGRRPAGAARPDTERTASALRPAEPTVSLETTASAAAVSESPVDPFTAVFGDAFIQVEETRPRRGEAAARGDRPASFDELLGDIAAKTESRPAAPRSAPAAPQRPEPERFADETPRAVPTKKAGKKPRGRGRPAPVSDAAGGRKPVRVRVKRQKPTGSGRRSAAKFASLAAMSFVALMTVATTIPSLSLMSSQDVQAMAMNQLRETQGPQQSVEINGTTQIASTGHEGYESMSIMEYAEAAGIRPEATFTNNPLGTIQWPFAVGVHIGDRFGYRDCAGCSVDHGGQDFNPGYGAEIQAIADGVVSVAENGGGSLGVHMMIDHVIDGEIVTSVYAHMQYDSMRFSVGDRIEVGDVIGLTGSTGMSTGPHLHFEIREGGVDGTKVDPLDWLYLYTN